MSPSDSPKLDQIQKWMQFVITHPEGTAAGVESVAARSQIPVTVTEVEQVVARSRSLTSLERLQIYGNAYYARLVECLREEFPALAFALGDEVFSAYAMGYLQNYPSQSYTLGKLGAKLPRFFAEIFSPAARNPTGLPGQFLIDLARLERIYSEVFDGPGSERQPGLTPDTLRQVPPDAWGDLKLFPAPSLRLEQFAYPVHEYITGVRREQSALIPEPAQTHLAICRRDFIVRRLALDPLQYKLLSKLVAGLPLGQAIAEALEGTHADLDKLARPLAEWFQDWTTRQFFAGVEYALIPPRP